MNHRFWVGCGSSLVGVLGRNLSCWAFGTAIAISALYSLVVPFRDELRGV
jgi:hypothetical protein